MELKKAACDTIENTATELFNISRDIWEHPELNYEEYHAHKLLTNFLEKSGFDVERNYIVDTAFRATVGDSTLGPNVCVICEYDALPTIGHACGHNLIAEVGVAAGLGIKHAFKTAGKPLGMLTVLGCPAEEGGSGKIRLIDGGAFKDIDVAMMVHPAPFDGIISTLAAESIEVKYKGQAVHASAFPWKGVNALDAAVLCYQTVSCMRQQMKPSWRISGIIRNGGVKPNIIPEISECEYIIRADTKSDLDTLRRKTIDCFDSAARATGCTVEYSFWDQPYLNVIQNKSMSSIYKTNLKSLGIDLDAPVSTDEVVPMGSTDMGNVSYVVPSIHPFYDIGTKAFNHTRDFATASGSMEAQSSTLIQGKALAMSAIDIYSNTEMMEQIKAGFENDLKHNANLN